MGIRFYRISKAYDGHPVLKDIDIEVREGELFTLLGSSGCGKTTLLRILAGFEKPDSGRIEINHEDITGLVPEKRGISMVFQNYALFPHMNVFENVGYGLKIRGTPVKKIRMKVEKCLAMVRLEEFANRDINELSGGEQQRVAIARALAVDPKVLLLDEPLSNLDAGLREKTRMEIRELQKELGITTVFVTHDQQEAMSISDRIAVFHRGKVSQVGSPDTIYNHPKDEFTANFIGESNIIGKEDFPLFFLSAVDADKVCIRPQNIHFHDEGKIKGEMVRMEFRGSFVMYHCRVGKMEIKIMALNSGAVKTLSPGETVTLRINAQAVKILKSSEKSRED
jgi:ABC-type Fe3+/spermidine/putrescine transport system ATPase subunit